jgi:hypothetical protein
MDQKTEAIETYLMLLRHEMGVDGIKTVGKEFIEYVVDRAGGDPSEVADVLKHSAVRPADNGEYFIDES